MYVSYYQLLKWKGKFQTKEGLRKTVTFQMFKGVIEEISTFFWVSGYEQLNSVIKVSKIRCYKFKNENVKSNNLKYY